MKLGPAHRWCSMKRSEGAKKEHVVLGFEETVKRQVGKKGQEAP